MRPPDPMSRGYPSNYSQIATPNSGRGGFVQLTEEKMQNMKSPTWLKLEAMIQTLNMYRNEMAGKRIPKFKQKYMEMKQREKDSERKVLNNQNS